MLFILVVSIFVALPANMNYKFDYYNFHLVLNSTSSNIDPQLTYPAVYVALALLMVLSSFVILRKFLATDEPKQSKTSILMISHIPIAVCKKGTEFFLSHIK
jgi:hypothetical protein